jgi:hypothetical protein
VSAARHAYGAQGVAVAEERTSVASGMLPLLILVIGLAAATVWFVALHALEKPPAEQSCEVVFVRSGTTRCVEKPVPRSRAMVQKSKPSRRAKH